MAPWLLPRIDDWTAAACLGPCGQLNSSQSLRPWKLRPPSRPHCQCPQPNSSLLTESATVSFSGFCNFLRVRGPSSHFLRSRLQPTTLIFFFTRPDHICPFHSQACDHSFLAASQTLLETPRPISVHNPHFPRTVIHIRAISNRHLPATELSDFIAPFCASFNKFYHNPRSSPCWGSDP